MERVKKVSGTILAIVLLVAGGIWIWKGGLEFQKDGKVLVTPPADVKIGTYSLAGQIVSIDKDAGRIVFNAYVFYKDKDTGEIKPEQELRSAVITADTKFTKMTQSDKEGIRVVGAVLDDFSVGANINVYYSKDPTAKYETTADKVEITL